jgi:hypothetical protein
MKLNFVGITGTLALPDHIWCLHFDGQVSARTAPSMKDAPVLPEECFLLAYRVPPYLS